VENNEHETNKMYGKPSENHENPNHQKTMKTPFNQQQHKNMKVPG
jgi:hypothetical protein